MRIIEREILKVRHLRAGEKRGWEIGKNKTGRPRRQEMERKWSFD